MDIIIQDKNTGDTHSAGEFNIFKAAINSKADKDALQAETDARIANELVFEAAFQTKVNKTTYADDLAALNAVDESLQLQIDNISVSGGTGIDSYSKIESDSKFSHSGHTHTFVSIMGRPSSLSGYNILDAYSKGDTDVLLTDKVDKVSGYSLIANAEILRLSGVTNQDISGKVDKVTNYSLIANAEITRLSTVVNQDLSGKENVGVASGLVNALKDGNAVDTIASLKTYITTLQSVDATISGQISDLMATLDSDNTALDTLQEIVDYIEANRESIDAVLVNKLNKSVYDAFLTGYTATIATIATKVDKDGAKVLSDNNYTSIEKSKLASIASGATVNSSDSFLLNLGNATGALVASAITQNTTARFVTDTEKATWNAKVEASAITSFISNSTDTFGSKVTNIVSCTQAEYEGLTPNSNTFYIIL